MFGYYDVEGYDRPLYLTEDHAALIGGTPHFPDVEGQPKRNATREEWAAYAVAQGADIDIVEGKTRTELISEYGG